MFGTCKEYKYYSKLYSTPNKLDHRLFLKYTGTFTLRPYHNLFYVL